MERKDLLASLRSRLPELQTTDESGLNGGFTILANGADSATSDNKVCTGDSSCDHNTNCNSNAGCEYNTSCDHNNTCHANGTCSHNKNCDNDTSCKYQNWATNGCGNDLLSFGSAL